MDNTLETTSPDEATKYESPSITRLGSLSELTKEGQRANADSRNRPSTAKTFPDSF